MQVHRALYRGRNPVAVKMLTDPDLRSADPETLRSFKVGACRGALPAGLPHAAGSGML